MSESGQLEKQLEDVTSARRDLEDSSKQIKNLEKQMRGVTQERDDLQKVEALSFPTVDEFLSPSYFLSQKY